MNRTVSDLAGAAAPASRFPPPVVIPGIADRDELGDMARAVAVLRDAVVAATGDRAALARAAFLADTALQNMGHGLLMLDHEGRVSVVNSSYVELFGLPSAPPEGCSVTELCAMTVAAGNHPGSTPEDVAEVIEADLAAGEALTFSQPFARRDGCCRSGNRRCRRAAAARCPADG